MIREIDAQIVWVLLCLDRVNTMGGNFVDRHDVETGFRFNSQQTTYNYVHEYNWRLDWRTVNFTWEVTETINREGSLDWRWLLQSGGLGVCHPT